ncbi:MAG: sulfatase-like hydrolase/transferase [Candidatus Marinimicrobia bacterium]|nr:sulfatase-like hydrolase/transferase [Candidatus Neomarinimicrobiota bacterium]
MDEFVRQLQVYLFAVAYLGLFRIVLIVTFRDRMEAATTIGDVLSAMAHGFRFDSGIAGYFMIIPILANLMLSPLGLTPVAGRIRWAFSGLMLAVLALAFVITIPYFREYDSQFDYFLFELLYDDRSAVFATVIQEYHFFRNLIAVMLLIWLSYVLLRQWLSAPMVWLSVLLGRPHTVLQRTVTITILILLAAGAARGSFRSRPAMRKWSHITSDVFLNKTVMNPARHLYYAVKDFRAINSRKRGIRTLLGNVSARSAAGEYFGVDLPADQSSRLSRYLRRETGGRQAPVPDHIFLIVLESFDAWPLMEQYRSLGLAENIRALGERGQHYDHFLPAGGNTIAAISTFLTGVPYTGVNISRIAATGEPLLTATPAIFKRLGYTTRFYYGGFLSWQNLGNLFLAQGMDEVFAAPDVEGDDHDWVWGVEDRELFDFAAGNIPSGERTFNIILTTSYHPPFNLDLEAEGFPLARIPENIDDLYDGSIPMAALGHIWYSDLVVGEFVRAVEAAYPSSMFAITGDHYSRRFLNANPTIYEHSSVPFILYGPRIVPALAARNPLPGSHLDIIPTLVELIAPAGFEYYTFGKPLSVLIPNGPLSGPATFGLGYKTVVTENFIANFKYNPDPQLLPGASGSIDQAWFETLKTRHDQLLGLGWWLIFNGEDLTPTGLAGK